MKPIEQLRDQILQDHPNTLLLLTPPLREGGVWSLDIDLVDAKVALEWSKQTGFGISSVNPDNFGERPDETFGSVSEARTRINELLNSSKKTVPPYGISLGRLRERCGLTQQELAQRLGVRQATISGMERRDDIQLSTLRRTLKAMGGALKIFGQFADAQYRIELLASGVISQPENEDVSFSDQNRFGNFRFNYETAFPCLHAKGKLPQTTIVAQDIRKNRAVLEMPL
jgi:transcriptional regulator with XRE-family HTH domain